MIVAELIEKLQNCPQDYEVVSESGDGYSSGYLAWVDEVNEVEVNDKNKVVILAE